MLVIQSWLNLAFDDVHDIMLVFDNAITRNFFFENPLAHHLVRATSSLRVNSVSLNAYMKVLLAHYIEDFSQMMSNTTKKST